MSPKLVWIIFRREIASYFATPLALIFIVIFLAMNGVFTFYLGSFYERGQADLFSFFSYHPWLYLFLVPAVAMRVWAEDRNSGTVELLMTLPLSLAEIVLGKFFAAWAFVGIALGLTFPIWLTVNYLGEPDNGIIIASYIGSFLMAGGFLSIGTFMSACTKSQVIAFVLGVVVCFIFVVSGFPLVLDAFTGWAPQPLIDAVAAFSFLSHFSAIAKGVLDTRDVFYFISVIACWLLATAIILDLKKAD